MLCLVVFFASHMFSSFPEGEQGEEGWGLGVSFSRTTVAFSLHSGIPIWRSSRPFALTQQQTIIVRLPKLNAAEMSSSFRLWSNVFLMLLFWISLACWFVLIFNGEIVNFTLKNLRITWLSNVVNLCVRIFYFLFLAIQSRFLVQKFSGINTYTTHNVGRYGQYRRTYFFKKLSFIFHFNCVKFWLLS